MRPILVVEDDPAICEVLQAVLEEEGLRVQTATNGQQAIALIERYQPRLAVLDFMLGTGPTGGEVAETLRTRYGEAVPIVFISAASMMARPVAERIGAAIFLPKPFDLDELITAIHRLLAA